MAFTEDVTIVAGTPTKASEGNAIADNTDWLQDQLKLQHDLDITTSTGRHLDTTPLSDSAKDLGTAALRWRVVYADTLGDTGQDLAIGATVISFAGAGTIDTSGNNALTLNAGTAALTITAGDATLYDATNNADTSLSIGTSATERLKIEVLNGAANQSAESINIVSQTAAAGANAGQITVGVDDATILTIDDGGINTILGATTPAAITGTTITANTGIVPDADDGAYLGTTALGFSDLFLATGGVINWANGQVTITETDENTLTIAGVATRLDLAAGILELNNAVEWDTGVAVVATEYSVGRDADATNQLHFNVPTGAAYEWSVNDAALMNLTTAGLLLVGYTASAGAGSQVQIHGTTGSTSNISVNCYRASAAGPQLNFGKGGATTLGAPTIVANDYVLGQIVAYGADGVDFATVGAAIYFRVNGTPAADDIPGEIELATYDGGAQTGSLILDAAGDAILKQATLHTHFTLDASAGYSTYLYFAEAGAIKYDLSYRAGGNYFALWTTDSDGGGTDADVLRIPDGQLTVDGNSTFDSNAFHYIHECGWHGIDDVGTCPRCGGGPVEWQDDVRLMAEAVQPTLRCNPAILSRLEKLGIVNTYGGADLFISMNKVPWFLMSGLVQERGLREQEEASLREELVLLRQEHDTLRAEMATLKERN